MLPAQRATAAARIVSAFCCAACGAWRWMNEQPSRRLAKATAFSPSFSSRAIRSKVGPWKRGEQAAMTR